MGSGASNLFTQNPMKKNFPHEEVPSFKIVLVGDSNVGKSSIFLRYTREQFDYSYLPTMNVSIGNVTKKVLQPYETLVSVTLWDLPGRGEIDLRRSYYKDIDAAIVVVDLCDEGSIDMAGTWKQDIVNNAFYTGAGDKLHKKDIKSQMQVPILLVGNKMDKIIMNEDADEAPKPIQRLEEIAVLHSFVGCVVVSACNSDGGVSAAFRSLVHYLLDKKKPNKSKDNIVVEKKNLKDMFSDPTQHGKFTRDLTSIDDHIYQPLQSCKVEEFDELFKKCDKEVKVIETCCIAFLIAVKNFKRSCCVSGVTETYKASIEECITNYKETLRDNFEEEVLIAHEEAGFIRLEINEEKKGIPGPLRRVLEIYDNEICKTTRRVLSQCPVLQVSLSDSLKTLTTLNETASNKASVMDFSKKQIKISLQIINNNILRIEDTIALAGESMKATDDQFKKIKSAMMW